MSFHTFCCEVFPKSDSQFSKLRSVFSVIRVWPCLENRPAWRRRTTEMSIADMMVVYVSCFLLSFMCVFITYHLSFLLAVFISSLFPLFYLSLSFFVFLCFLLAFILCSIIYVFIYFHVFLSAFAFLVTSFFCKLCTNKPPCAAQGGAGSRNGCIKFVKRTLFSQGYW
jgi:hypothetical protein